ncbi:hypothetical protein [Paraburkholderia sp. BL17N1]|uniref:hypothetical protein n=1 Tax=Paraburkholderia sp. BL17N1 TaxID=1938798 RepID=UPI000EACA660|nr:hypothetical protein [Paraburkholderia sp. BL17N1]RKR37655.1 hypothetical protein B0G82_5749 [Paraburkholderia sp. BL17N1]
MFGFFRERDEVGEALQSAAAADFAHQTQQRKHREDFQERQRRAQQKRWAFDAGPQVGPRWFEKVTFRERWSDRIQALHDVWGGVHRYTDPVTAYNRYLFRDVKAARAAMNVDAAINNTLTPDELALDAADAGLGIDRKTLLIRRRRAIVVMAQENLEVHNLYDAEEDTRYLTILEEGLRERLAKERVVFDKWKEKLKRPAYMDRLGDLKGWFQGKAVDRDLPATPPAPTSLSERVKGWFGKVLNVGPIVLIPAEAVFAFPAFEFLTPDDKAAAYVGAAIFTTLLGLLGHAFAMSILRAFPNYADDEKRPWRERYRLRQLLSAILVLLCALLMVGAGADLRSKLPDIAAVKEMKGTLKQLERQQASAAYNNKRLENNDGVAKFASEVEVQKKAINDKSAILYTFNPSLDKSDKLVAIGVYLALFLLSAARMVLSRDPVFEYQLASMAVRDLEDALLRIEAWRQVHGQGRREETKNLRLVLAKAKTELGVVNPGDPLALPSPTEADDLDDKAGKAPGETPATAGDAKVASDEDKSDSTENHAVATFNQLSRKWRVERSRRYTYVYDRLSRNGLSAYGASRSKALGRIPFSEEELES